MEMIMNNPVFKHFYTCYMHDGIIEATKLFKEEVPHLVEALIKEIDNIESTSSLDEYAKCMYPNLYAVFSSINNLKKEIKNK